MKKIVKAIIIIIFCGCLVAGSAKRAEAAAETATLAVVGGSIAGGGIGAALATVAPVALVIAGVALAAQGIYIVLSDEAEQAGMTKEDYLNEQFSIYAEATGNTVEEIYTNITNGANVLADGAISITENASETIYDWINYLLGNNVISSSSDTGSYVELNGVNCPVIDIGEKIDFYRYDGYTFSFENVGTTKFSACASTGDEAGYTYLYVFGVDEHFKISTYRNDRLWDNAQNYYGLEADGLYYTWLSNRTNFQDIYIPYVENFVSSVESLDGQFVIKTSGEGLLSDDLSGIDSGDFTVSPGYVNVLNPGIGLGDIASDYGRSGTITVDNYLQTLQRALNGVQDNTIAINDTLTGVLENVSVGALDLTDTATVSKEQEENIVAGVFTPAIDVNLNPTGEAAEQALNGLAFDLTDVFPFCIPFDLFALVSKFDAAREIPVVEMQLPLPGVNTTLDIDIDLTPFDTVATVLRTMELIAFVIGLAMVTRHIIRG